MENLLSSINSPADLKKLKPSDLKLVSDEMRETIIQKLTEVGGHVGPNLGIIETAVALHYVFNSPTDKFVWDVSHQSIPHKLLTGRQEQFKKWHAKGGNSSYTNIFESEHDHFNVGHTSSSIALAAGLAKGRDLQNQNHNVVAIMGDGSLSGGVALEGLNILGTLKSNFILVFNDNEMSIDYNAGGLYQGLGELRETQGQTPNNLFKFLGLDYKYLESGNDAEQLAELFASVKDIDHPIVLHIHTKKGKGVKWAEEDPKSWHYHAPFDLETGKAPIHAVHKSDGAATSKDVPEEFVSSSETTVEWILNEKDSCVIIPGSPNLGQTLQQKCPERYFDVGIAEQAAVGFGSGIAAAGFKPYLYIASTFLQRAYDQVMQDFAMNNVPATLIVSGASIGYADYSHTGMYDMAAISNIPNLVYLAPSCDLEYRQMLQWCKEQPYSTAIRLSGIRQPKSYNRPTPEIELKLSAPANPAVSDNFKTEPTLPAFDIEVKSEVFQKGSEIAILGLGWYFHKARVVAELLKKQGINATVINPRFASHLDTNLLDELVKTHKVIATLEDGMLEGGFGEKVSSYLGATNAKVLNFGAKKEFLDSVSEADLLDRYHLNPEQIAADCLNVLN